MPVSNAWKNPALSPDVRTDSSFKVSDWFGQYDLNSFERFGRRSRFKPWSSGSGILVVNLLMQGE
jgi:hypothetical protein